MSGKEPAKRTDGRRRTNQRQPANTTAFSSNGARHHGDRRKQQRIDRKTEFLTNTAVVHPTAAFSEFSVSIQVVVIISNKLAALVRRLTRRLARRRKETLTAIDAEEL